MLSIMKKLNKMLLFLIVSVLFITSYKKDEVDPRDKLVGSYAVSETWTLDGGGRELITII
jgi:hypothetical protein